MKLRTASGGLILSLWLVGAALAQEPRAAAQTEVKAAAPVVAATTPAPSPLPERLILKEGNFLRTLVQKPRPKTIPSTWFSIRI